MNRHSFKYNINHQISMMPHFISIRNIEKVLDQYYGISPQQFAFDRSIKAGSDKEVPMARLKVYAEMFRVSIEMLCVESQVV